MTAAAAAAPPPPPARARLAQDGARPLVDVLSSPDALGRVEVRLPDGARRLVHAERLDPEDDAALELLTRVDRVVRRAGEPRPATPPPMPSGRPLKLGTVQQILGAGPSQGTPPDGYLLTADHAQIVCLLRGAVVSRLTLTPAQRERAGRIVAGMDKPPRPPGSGRRQEPKPTAKDYRRAQRRRPAVEWK